MPLEIPDGSAAGVGACILIGDSAIIADLNVELQIRHEWVGDLVITLFHEESATSITLIDRPGRPVEGFGFGCSRDDIDVVLDDEASLRAEDQCEDRTAISGRLLPGQLLSAFDGEAILGSWFMNVADVTGGDVGRLTAWSLIVNVPATPSVPTGDISCDGNVNSIDAALALQFGAGLLSSLACEAAGDVNEDGAIDALDAALILQFAASLLSELPCPGDVNGDGLTNPVDAALVLQFSAGLIGSLPP